MPPRRPSSQIDTERFMKRVESRIDQAFDIVLQELAKVQMEVRKGNLDTELMSQRVTDLERQVIETRQHMQVSDRGAKEAAEGVAAKVVTAAEKAPRSVWKTRAGMITVGSAAFVGIVAFFNNLPKFVRGASEMAVSLYAYIVRHR